jgi:hypothetical protein
MRTVRPMQGFRLVAGRRFGGTHFRANRLAAVLCALAAGIPSLHCQTAPAASTAPPAPQPSSPVSTPGMEGPLAASMKPGSLDVPGFGRIYVSGALTGIGLAEDSPFPGEREQVADISNAQVFVQKVDGEFQFFLDGGIYAFPELGAAYVRSPTETNDLYGPLPLAYVKYVPNSTFSFEAGKLPGIIGVEYPFTYENMNIFRGLLWNQEIPVTRGVQANFSSGPFSGSLSLNDGFYSNRYNWVSGMVTWSFSTSSSLSLTGSGNMGETGYASASTPLPQNNDSQLDNLAYSYTSGPWIAQAYAQYADTKSGAYIGIRKSASTWGAGLLANFAIPSTNFNLAGRAEVISTSGSAGDGSPNLLYGPGSRAYSATLTSACQMGLFFSRVEVSFVRTSSAADGYAFGPAGNDRNQARVVAEAGILF